jgi:hypothetical protein
MLMRVVFAAAIAAALFLMPSIVDAQDATAGPQTSPQQPAPAQSTSPAPQAPAAPPSTASPAQAGAPAATGASGAPPARAFTANAGLLFNTVKPERTDDFEKVIGYLQAALAKSTDPTIQAQARGWRVYRASEPGPNNTVLYVFVLDPAVPGADYGLGHILGQAYTDSGELQEIWRLYTNSVTSGGTLLNLVPVGAAAAPEATTPAPFALPDEQPKMLPPDADPNRR